MCATQDIFSEELVVNRENRGIKWVVAYIGGKPAIHPDLAKPTGEVEFTVEGCVFKPHVFAFRAGQKVKLATKDPISTVVKGDGFNNSFNPLLQAAPPGGKTVYELPEIHAEKLPIAVVCGCVHTWMKAWWPVFDHPYFAVTDENGNFEIQEVPTGKVNLVIWQETIGYGEGKGKGKEIEVRAGETTDLGELKLSLPETATQK